MKRPMTKPHIRKACRSFDEGAWHAQYLCYHAVAETPRLAYERLIDLMVMSRAANQLSSLTV